MIRIDATAVQVEDEVGQTEEQTQEQPTATAREITIPLPASCETTVRLLAELGADDKWRSGFTVHREYDPGEGRQISITEPPSGPEADAGYDGLDDCLTDACERAQWWLGANSADDDDRAREVGDVLDAWEAKSALDQAAEPAIGNAAEDAASPEQESPVPALAPGTAATPPTAPTDPAITDEAQRTFDEEKSRLEEIVANLAIGQVRLKTMLKNNRDNMKAYTDELQTHLLRGPVRLPLFDKATPASPDKPADELQAEAAVPEADSEPAPNECPRGGQHEPDSDGDCAKCREPGVGQPPAEPATEGNEPWRTKRLADLPGITEKIADILAQDGIYTIGDWVDWPTRNPGVEYTQIWNIVGRLTEKRYEKVMQAVTAATT